MNIEIGANAGDRQEDFLLVDIRGNPEIRADMRCLPFRHSLDRIYASHVLEHLPDADIVTALKSCRGALRPGGVLELYVPDLLWTMRKFLRAQSHGARWALWNRIIFGSQENEGEFHKTGFSVKRLADCLIAAGFRTIKTKRCKRQRRIAAEPFEHEMRTVTTIEVHAIAVA